MCCYGSRMAVVCPTRGDVARLDKANRHRCARGATLVPLGEGGTHGGAINGNVGPRRDPGLAVIRAVAQKGAMLRWQGLCLGHHDVRVVGPKGLLRRGTRRDDAVNSNNCSLLPAVVLAVQHEDRRLDKLCRVGAKHAVVPCRGVASLRRQAVLVHRRRRVPRRIPPFHSRGVRWLPVECIVFDGEHGVGECKRLHSCWHPPRDVVGV
mmetsp:Transcript_5634/g.14388  ORF Transcript_5634/g.14388 Transcript_5634/m.14388 type:complete len:208 (+) Transcript_5634:114-737(+)